MKGWRLYGEGEWEKRREDQVEEERRRKKSRRRGKHPRPGVSGEVEMRGCIFGGGSR
jgi:hypothetical protein